MALLEANLTDALENVIERETVYYEADETREPLTWLAGLDRDERADVVNELAEQFAVDARTPQRWIKYLLSEGGEERKPPRAALDALADMMPEPEPIEDEEIIYPDAAWVEVSGEICVSDDCRSRTVTIPLSGIEARKFIDAVMARGDDGGLDYIFPKHGRRGAARGIPGASVGPRQDEEDGGYFVTLRYVVS